MGLARCSGAPVRIRLRASFYTAVCATIVLLVTCLWWELRPAGSEAAAGRRLNSLYPPDALLTGDYNEDPNRWLVIFHCIGIGYMLLGLNTVCDVYFTGALEVMVAKWDIKADVAGATFMAAGGSAPEFFTSLIGSTIVFTDVGFSTIVGSAVFNVLFVIGLCGFVASGEIKLTWWPLFRDCTFYICGLSLLAVCAADELIGLAEAVGLFVAYLVYCLIMVFNPRIEALVDSKVRKAKKQVVPEMETPASKVLPLTEGEVVSCNMGEEDDNEEGSSTADHSAATTAGAGRSPSTYGKVDEDQPSGIEFHHRPSIATAATTVGTCVPGYRGSEVDTEIAHNMSGGAGTSPFPKPSEVLSSIGDIADDIGPAAEVASACEDDLPTAREDLPQEPPPEGAAEAASKAGSEEEEEDPPLIAMPDGTFNRIVWCASLPVYVPLYFLIPTPRAEKHMFLVCFIISLVWIAGFAFLLVWWTNTLALVLGVPDVIKDFTLLAMGTSIPDAASSVAVARMGEGDMAVSSSIGSNVFDILVGLPIPWIIKILIEGGNFDYQVTIFSPYLVFYVILLLGMVLSVILSIHFLGWKLNKALGAAMALLYILFLAVALTVEILRPTSLMI